MVRRASLLCAALILAASFDSVATPTDPFLALRNATVLAGAPAVVRFEGSFHADDLAQVPFPLQILVRSLTSEGRYVRVDAFGAAVVGNDVALSDGLQLAEVGALLDTGERVPDLTILERSGDRIDFVLPPDFPAGAAEVQLFVWNDGDPVLSNAMPISLGDAR